ncbi:MAG: pyrroline-5-carboxylate reductase [Candidatus Omnitrophota bacterium]|nr:MAG: pyrroline-5-carboxylate reductase [Candidatus Omnitrophota bacterium]
MAKKDKIGIIGFGNMGSAIGFALKAKGWQLFIYEKDKKKIKDLKGFKVASSAKELIESVEIVILAVKPQDTRQFLQTNKDYLKRKGNLLITIVAGIPARLYEKYVNNIRLLRIMPNLAAKVKESVSFMACGRFCKKKDSGVGKRIFSLVGEVIEIKEDLLDMVTAISGSGPGYIFYFMDYIYRSAIKLGLNREQAQEMVLQVFKGATKLAASSQKDFHLLVQEVASPRGTTDAALDVFNNANLGGIIYKGIDAAYRRAREISRLFV